MTDHGELVKALRCCGNEGCHKCPYQKHIHEKFCWVIAMKDAADAIERFVSLYEKAEMDATNLTGKLAQAEADIERLNLEIDKRIATEIELSNQVDALQAEVERLQVDLEAAYSLMEVQE